MNMYELDDENFLKSFPEHKREAILTSPIVYNFEKNYGQWSFAHTITQEELENKVWDPMVNYLYPLPDFDEQLPWIQSLRPYAEAIRPIGIIYIADNEEYYLCLAGANDDFTWEICYAYMMLGYLPPYWACKLVNYSGLDMTQIKNQQIAFGALKSIEIGKHRMEVRERELKYLFISQVEGYDHDGNIERESNES